MDNIFHDNTASHFAHPAVPTYLVLLEPTGIGATSCLANAVWMWSRYSAEDGRSIRSNVDIYLDKLASIDYSRPKQRTFGRCISCSTELRDQVAQQIATFALGLGFEEGIAFLVDLTVDWVMTYNADAIRTSAAYNHYQLKQNATDESLSRLLLKWIYDEIADILALDQMKS